MATPIKGNVTTVNQTPANSFYQLTHNQNTGTNGLLVFFITMANSVSPSSATYNGVAMTRLYTLNRSGLGQRMAFYYLVNPPTGNNALRINFSGNQWNSISAYARSFTDSGGIGTWAQTGGLTTPNTQSLTVSQDSLIMMTSCSINAITSQQIPTGTNQTYVQNNTNRQVAVGGISSNSGHTASTVSLRATATSGSLSLDRVEILGIATTPPSMTITPTSLNGMDYIFGNGASNTETFVVNAANLTGSVTVNVGGSDFEVGLSPTGNSWYSGLVLPQSPTGTISNLTVYVRLKINKAVGNYSSNSTVTTTGISAINLTFQGSVTESIDNNFMLMF